MNKTVIGFAGRGTKIHKAYFVGHGSSANCMHNSFNGQMHSVKFEVADISKENGLTDWEAVDKALTAWLDENTQYEVCGRCFKGYKREAA